MGRLDGSGAHGVTAFAMASILHSRQMLAQIACGGRDRLGGFLGDRLHALQAPEHAGGFVAVEAGPS